jgi:hypothetical protein
MREIDAQIVINVASDLALRASNSESCETYQHMFAL